MDSNCKTMPPIWQDLANEFNKPQNQEIVIAQVDCQVERDLCYGMHIIFSSETIQFSQSIST